VSTKVWARRLVCGCEVLRFFLKRPQRSVFFFVRAFFGVCLVGSGIAFFGQLHFFVVWCRKERVLVCFLGEVFYWETL